MLQYEIIDVWESIHDLLIEWIESVILEGWNIYRNKATLNRISETLVNRIALSLQQDFQINEEQLVNMTELFKPTISNWIDNILLINAGFYRDQSKFTEFAIFIARDLMKIFLNEVNISD
ncbi:MAG: hypothetical protein GOP50_08075 [Candidatus Heimdallarchaeota archaeon]|nr:hypothetical protein [Candidatus Heimdallarchaeota archaeon]